MLRRVAMIWSFVVLVLTVVVVIIGHLRARADGVSPSYHPWGGLSSISCALLLVGMRGATRELSVSKIVIGCLVVAAVWYMAQPL